MLKGIIIISATVLVTIGIKASDSLFGDNDNSLCSSDMIFIPSANGGFCIDKYEASPGKNCPVKEILSQKDSRKNMTTSSCNPISKEGISPWIYISQTQAREACARAGKRLATNKEWLAASLGTPDKNKDWGYDDCQVDENWKNQPGKTGSAKNCESSFGVFDMIGNVWEWTDETINDGKLNGEELPGQGFVSELRSDGIAMETKNKKESDYNNDYFWIKNSGIRAIARGGFYSNKEEAGVYSSYLVSKPSCSGVGIGFRCVR